MNDIVVAATHDPQSSGSRLRVVAKEYRFSVVMYGGVSLAIYMNGIAQELLHMVRSTARTSWDNEAGTDFRYPDKQLSGTEKIYRAVARALNDSGVDDVRFVIDTISGTSAGGINGIFLAKALTDDSLDFGALQNLWITEGALERLLNDDQTATNSQLDDPDPPKSLLCSDRMYIQLLNAFRKMEETAQKGGQPLSQEIDLFVTTTDITGRVIPLRLSDRLVYERQYKTDFHFHFKMPRQDGSQSPGHNDLLSLNNPFIAFVARCTSSFPFAFEPMQLKKLEDLQKTKAWPTGLTVSDAQLRDWEDKFFDNSSQISTGPNRTRAFGDGGYLNNKPFSYVVETLGRHSSTFPTERNLIYVEPTPDHPESDARLDQASAAQGTNAPNAVQNSFDALMKLPGYQAIHDDLQRVIERNRLVRKVAELSAAVTAQLDGAGMLREAGRAVGKTLPELGFKHRFALLHPVSYGDFGYLNLCVYSTTDQLAKVLSQWFGYPPDSSYYYAVRCLVRTWREQSYRKDEVIPEREVGKAKCFLNDFDLDYEKRRYRFVRQQINVFYTLDETATKRLRTGFGKVLLDSEKEDFRKALIALKKPFDEASGIISDTLREIRPTRKPPSDVSSLTPLEKAFGTLKEADEVFAQKNIAATLDTNVQPQPTPAGALNVAPAALSPGLTVIDYVLGVETRSTTSGFAPSPADVGEDYLGRAAKVMRASDSTLSEAIRGVADVLSALIVRGIEQSRIRLREQWAALAGALPRSRGAEVAAHIVNFFYANFESFDIAIFPLTYDTDVGVPELIKILRVSPDDANSIYNQTEHPNDPKLAGTSLAHFGAFLDRSFRTNDILWGRLDGAERIIRALLGDGKSPSGEQIVDVQKLIKEANEAIVTDFLHERKDVLQGVVFEVAKSLDLNLKQPAQLSQAQIDAIKARAAQVFAPLPFEKVELGSEKVIDYLKQPPPPRGPDRQTTLQSITRTVRVMGGILEGLSKETQPAGGFVIRCSTALWWLVEAAIPDGLSGHFARKFFALLFLFEIFLVVAGTLFSHPMQTLGLETLAITTAFWLAKDAFQSFILRGKSGLQKTAIWGAVAILGGLAIWGSLLLWGDKLPLFK